MARIATIVGLSVVVLAVASPVDMEQVLTTIPFVLLKCTCALPPRAPVLLNVTITNRSGGLFVCMSMLIYFMWLLIKFSFYCKLLPACQQRYYYGHIFCLFNLANKFYETDFHLIIIKKKKTGRRRMHRMRSDSGTLLVGV